MTLITSSTRVDEDGIWCGWMGYLKAICPCPRCKLARRPRPLARLLARLVTGEPEPRPAVPAHEPPASGARCPLCGVFGGLAYAHICIGV